MDLASFGDGKLVEEGHPSPNGTVGEQLGMAHCQQLILRSQDISLPPGVSSEYLGSRVLWRAPPMRVVVQVSRTYQSMYQLDLSTYGFVGKKNRRRTSSFPPHLVDHPFLFLAGLLVDRSCDDGRWIGFETGESKNYLSSRCYH